MKIVSIVGTRPNFTKEYSINEVCLKNKIDEVIVHTGQHYDYEMSRIFFKELDLPMPKYINEIIKGPQGYETGTMLAFIEQVLLQERPDVTLVYGDVNSTIAGALASVKLKIPVAHIEAGLRSKFFYNPEEINRRATDAISEILFPHIQEAYDALIKENFLPENVFLYGDVVKDSLLKIIHRYKLKISKGNYFLVTIHRSENTESPQKLSNIFEALVESSKPIKLPLHPRTKAKLMQYDLWDRAKKAKNIEIMEPLGFLEFIKLLAGADKVLTDSGGVRREAYILGKPIITLTDIVWVQEMVDCGWSRVVGDDKEKIIDAIYNHNPSGDRPDIFGKGNAAEKIIGALLERYG